MKFKYINYATCLFFYLILMMKTLILMSERIIIHYIASLGPRWENFWNGKFIKIVFSLVIFLFTKIVSMRRKKIRGLGNDVTKRWSYSLIWPRSVFMTLKKSWPLTLHWKCSHAVRVLTFGMILKVLAWPWKCTCKSWP